MKVSALIESPGHVCYRYRIAAFAGFLAERGWDLEAIPLARNMPARRQQLHAAAESDVVVVQRKLLPLWQIRILRRAACTVVYDFDDAVFCRDSFSRKGTSSWTRKARFWFTVRAADAVTAGNPYLARKAAACTDKSRVHLLPTCVDPARYPMANHSADHGETRLVWIGQRSTLPYLHLAQDQFSAAAREVSGLRLRVVSDEFPELEHVKVVPRRWSDAGEAHELAQADIGISWLPNDPWTAGKCGLKVLQYMAAGLPVVANPVAMNAAMVQDGQTGFLASTPREWAEAIGRLARDPELRSSMGTAGRRFVEQEYSVRRWGPTFAAIVDSLRRPAATSVPSGMSPHSKHAPTRHSTENVS